MPPTLAPLAYHREIRAFLETHAAETWAWFASAEARRSYADALRLDLLKSTYRLDVEEHAQLYELATQAAQTLGLSAPLTLYQAQAPGEAPGAALCFAPAAAHVVLIGGITQLLTPEELQVVIAHELAHHQLWTVDQGAYFVTGQVLYSMAEDPRAEPSHFASARLYSLYSEIFADRGALLATGDLQRAVGSLVKVHTGLATASGRSYLKQAEEIFASGEQLTEGLSHPEAFIRARALQLWAEQRDTAGDQPDADDQALSAQLRNLIEGPPKLDALDLLAQQRLTTMTRQLVQWLLRPAWFRSEVIEAQARLLFADLTLPECGDDGDLAWLESARFHDEKLQSYVCYLLLDFIAADPDLGELPLARGLELAEMLDLSKPFADIVNRELKIKKRDLTKLRNEAAELQAKAAASVEE